jgi:hypothetical protein
LQLSKLTYFTYILVRVEDKEEMSFNVDSALVGNVMDIAVATTNGAIGQVRGAHDEEE